MSFGLTAAQVGMIGMGAGALMGGQGGSNSATQSTQNQLDPNLLPYLYGQGGLMSGVNNLYQQQAGQGGLNPMQTAGLEMQRRTLMNPAFTQGFDQMRSLGAGLMGQGVAGNPFTGGLMASGMPTMAPLMNDARRSIQPVPGRASALGFGGGFDPTAAAFQPIQQATAAPNVAPPSNGAPATVAAPTTDPLADFLLSKYGPGGYGSGYDGGGNFGNPGSGGIA